MNILITGGAGFIGSNFVKWIAKSDSNSRLVVLDKLTYAGRLENLEEMKQNPNYKFIKGDICDEKLVSSILKNEEIDTIVHFAAESHVDNSITGPRAFVETNVMGTFNLLECARKAENKITKFLHISTDETYGSIEDGSFLESSPLEPNSPYSASKASSDLIARSYFQTFKLPLIVTRTCNNYGPNQFTEKLIPLFITNIMEGKKVPVYGDGKNVREWIYVEDNCSALEFVLKNGKDGEIYNIGSGMEKTNLEITNEVLKHFGRDEKSIEFVEDRKGHDWRYAINCEKLKSMGWKPKHSFEDGMKKTIEWYEKNQAWWKPLKK